MTGELVGGYTYHMMMEMVEITDSGKEELLGFGSLEELEEGLREAIQDSEDGGYDWPNLRIQPAK